MAIEFYSEDVDLPKIDINKCEQWFAQVVENQGFVVGDITIVFVSDNYLLEMNNQYLDHDYYTDIITFDYTEEKTVSGDLFISVDTVLSNSQEFGVDYLNELHRVMIHGVLHLIGFDDKSEEHQLEMTKMENSSLELLLN
ncbi:MAG: rRNA maturation RNase YbeY [Marinilabiliaceae bacterium]|nr:rRNA maturation RNase YbeY [Marinilabiliaceae bacterium]